MNNISVKSNYRFDIPDNKQSNTFQWQVQSVQFPGVNIETARVVRSPKLSNTMMAGSGTTFEDLQVTFLIDEDMLAYAEMYEWMLTMQNYLGPTTESHGNVPKTALLYIMDNTRENIVTTFKFHEIYPKSINDIEWNYTETGDLDSMTSTVIFGYTHFDMIMPDGKEIGPRVENPDNL